MSRAALFAAAAVLAAVPAQAQRLDVDPARASSYQAPVLIRPGELIASDISEADARVGLNRRTEHFAFTGRAGEVVTVRVRSDIPDLEVVVLDSSFSKLLARGPAKDAALRATLPKDGSYFVTVAAKGPQPFGKYLLSFGSGDSAPPFEAPPRAVQVAQAPAALPAASLPAAPAVLPPMPVIPGVTNVRVGQPLARPVGKPGAEVELFAFIGEAGSILQASATGAAGYGLTLYTPEGAEMLSASGLDSARLAAALPQDGIYLLAVARQDGAKPYKLALSAEPADDFLWSFRSYAGYEILAADGSVAYWSCWVVPGTLIQYHLPNGRVQRLTVRRGGAGHWDLPPNPGYNFTTRLEGSKVIRTSEFNTVQTWSLDDPPKPHGAYRGYLCK